MKQLFEFWAKTGIFLPMAYDSDKKGPSATLFFAYVANILAIGSIGYLLKDHAALGALAAIGYALSTIGYYLIRRLSHFKVDINDGEFEADGVDESPEEKGSMMDLATLVILAILGFFGVTAKNWLDKRAVNNLSEEDKVLHAKQGEIERRIANGDKALLQAERDEFDKTDDEAIKEWNAK